MDERRKCMFNTVIFDRVLDNEVPNELLTNSVHVYATHVQRDELSKTKRPERRNELKRVFVGLGPTMGSTETAVWGVSKWGQAKWSKDDQWKRIKLALDKLDQKENNRQDALIAETAIKNGYTLVTADRNLRKVAAEFGADCMTFEELQQLTCY